MSDDKLELLARLYQEGYACGYKDGYANTAIANNGEPVLHDLCGDTVKHCQRIVQHLNQALPEGVFDKYMHGYWGGYSLGAVLRYQYQCLAHSDTRPAMDTNVGDDQYVDMQPLVDSAVQLYNDAMHSDAAEDEFNERYVRVPFGIEDGGGVTRKYNDLSPFICDKKGEGMLFFVCSFGGSEDSYIFPAFGFDSKEKRVLEQNGFYELFKGGYKRHGMKLVAPAACRLANNRIDMSISPHIKQGAIVVV
ncbi:MAG: hypothetical protein FWC92_08145 [Defluviitaleaceae bacterium]|nr:hypothetical protein [Defluviitaleaceae bacterium]